MNIERFYQAEVVQWSEDVDEDLHRAMMVTNGSYSEERFTFVCYQGKRRCLTHHWKPQLRILVRRCNTAEDYSSSWSNYNRDGRWSV